MKQKVKKFFELSSIERRGVIFLIVLIIIIFCVQAYLTIKIPVNKSENFIFAADSELIKIKPAEKSKETFYTRKKSFSVNKLFNFDPNTITIADMRKLGMDDKTVKSLTNYRLAGGRFYKEDDIQKIYGLSGELFILLRPYIVISKTNNFNEQFSPLTEKGTSIQYDINNIDTTKLQQINGIGKVLATRIIKYRNLLGGYYSIDQLKEVYGLTDDKISIIKKDYTADTAKIIKISLNHASEFEIGRHPYLGKFAAKAIINYRLKVVKIRSINEIFINGIMPKNDYEKLKNYLAI